MGQGPMPRAPEKSAEMNKRVGLGRMRKSPCRGGKRHGGRAARFRGVPFRRRQFADPGGMAATLFICGKSPLDESGYIRSGGVSASSESWDRMRVASSLMISLACFTASRIFSTLGYWA